MFLQLPSIKTQENLYKNVNKKCRPKKLGMIYTILGSFWLFLNWLRADIWPEIRPRKIPVKHGFP